MKALSSRRQWSLKPSRHVYDTATCEGIPMSRANPEQLSLLELYQ
jgi:hypothetical protein